ncbi:GNAT family N-acetyltransferase [Shewanella goraebulensis]|uniref:GNAT family N-acetyltransferase n=1 Tax=Shewanella goraebulensis TaxID=3050637 RepID=UPI00254E994A|nr:GNAT family N-acetyltransferase [Shewanella goraebulensis]
MSIKYRLATEVDAVNIADLELQYMNDELSSSADTMSGQCFSKVQISELIKQGWIMLAELNTDTASPGVSVKSIIGYVIAGPWSWFQAWGIYAQVLRKLSDIEMGFSRVTSQNSCQYGPIWIHPSHRGQGIFEHLVKGIQRKAAMKYSFMVTFIAEDNAISFAAHTKKSAMEVVDYFSFQQRDYYLLVMKN